MTRMKRKDKRLISCLLVLTMFFGLNLSGLRPAEASAAQPTKKGDSSVVAASETANPFAPIHFAEWYTEDKVNCEVEGVSLNAETVEDGLLVSGKNNVVSGAAISLTDTIDFGEEKVSRIQINALAKRATKTYFQLYIDDAAEPLVEYRMTNQSKEDNWSKDKTYTYEFPKDVEKLSGTHTIHIKLIDKTTKADKKTTILLRSLQFVQDSIPVISFDLDEEMGTISDMNSDQDHATECYGKMNITVPDGYAAEYGKDAAQAAKDTAGSYDLDYIRGRGNSTWMMPKKPYKVKLDKKADLFGMGANKHWVLLANYFDNSLLRNRLTYYLGKQLGMEYTPKLVPVDVIINHEYLGSYYLCEQIRLGESRVDENDLEAALAGSDVSGGYLLSMSPYGDEIEYVATTSRENQFLVESPAEGECLEDATAYIDEYLQKTEDAIYGDNFQLSDGTSYKDLMDVPSAVAYYWMQEFSMNGDAFISTSTYLHKKKDTEEEKGKLYWGPLWDFDYVAWSSYDYSMSEDSYSGFINQRTWFERLMEDEEFADEVKAYWKTKLKPALQAAIADGGILDQYADEIRISATNNFNKWGYYDFGEGDDDWWDLLSDKGYDYGDEDRIPAGSLTFDEEVERLKNWISLRIGWVDENLDSIAPTPITLTYKVDGEVYQTVDAMAGREVGSVPDAPKAPEGYAFLGWYYTENIAGEEIESRAFPDDIYMQDMEFTAKWIPKSQIVQPESVQVERNKIYVLQGEEINLQYAVLPYNVMDDTVTIESSDENIVGQDYIFDFDDYYGDVMWDYVWMAKNPGTATITIKTSNGKTASCEVTVVSWEEVFEGNDYILDKFDIDKEEITLKPGEYGKINLQLTPERAITDFTWRSTNSDVVMVQAGTVMALKPGKAYILVSASGSEDIKICEVNVTGEAASAKPSATPDQKPQQTAQPQKTPLPTEKPAARSFVKGNLKYRITKNAATVTGVTKAGKKAKKITIPATVKNSGKTYQVTGIATKAFAKHKTLKTVVIGKNVKSIGKSAFKGCKKLKTVKVKTSKLKKVEKDAFANISKSAVFKLPKKKAKAYKKFFK
ncbi:MAG: CotH kinase family protein [Lachnospiraceae bacterium]|nr:CotH kinase family protein [Lachnospiraceae bacterium]